MTDKQLARFIAGKIWGYKGRKKHKLSEEFVASMTLNQKKVFITQFNRMLRQLHPKSSDRIDEQAVLFRLADRMKISYRLCVELLTRVIHL